MYCYLTWKSNKWQPICTSEPLFFSPLLHKNQIIERAKDFVLSYIPSAKDCTEYSPISELILWEQNISLMTAFNYNQLVLCLRIFWVLGTSVWAKLGKYLAHDDSLTHADFAEYLTQESVWGKYYLFLWKLECLDNRTSEVHRSQRPSVFGKPLVYDIVFDIR